MKNYISTNISLVDKDIINQIVHVTRTDLNCTLIPLASTIMEKNETSKNVKLFKELYELIKKFEKMWNGIWWSENNTLLLDEIEKIWIFMDNEIIPTYQSLDHIEITNTSNHWEHYSQYRQSLKSNIEKYKILLSIFNMTYRKDNDYIDIQINESNLFSNEKNELSLYELLNEQRKWIIENKKNIITVDYESIVNIRYQNKRFHRDLLLQFIDSIIVFWCDHCKDLQIWTTWERLMFSYTTFFDGTPLYNTNQPFDLLYLVIELLNKSENIKIITDQDNQKNTIMFI